MTEEKKELKDVLEKTTNSMALQGELYEKELIFYDQKKQPINTTNPHDERINRIGGSISIRVGEDDIFKTSVNCFRKKADGGINKMYANYEKYLSSEYVAANSEEGREQGGGTTVRCNTTLSPTKYYNGNDIRTGMFINFTGMKRKTLDEDEYTTTGEIVGMITNMEHETEVVDGEVEETGRLILEVAGVGYKGDYLPFVFYVSEEKASAVEANYAEGDTAHFYVKLHNERIGGSEVQQVEELGFGGDDDEKEIQLNEGFTITRLITYKASLPYSEENGTETLMLDKEAIEAAIKIYEEQMEQDKNEKEAGSKGKSRGNGAKSQGKNAQVKESDIPF